jgi:hypothetical protein
MKHAAALAQLVAEDAFRWEAPGVVRALALPDCWIGAGFVRNAVWDRLHGRAPACPQGDVDVVWFDSARCDSAIHRSLEVRLASTLPGVDWSVANQARMHTRNDDPPYTSSTDAIAHWPETATAVAVRRMGDERCEIIAPYGLDDLFELRLAPTPFFRGAKLDIVRERTRSKRWRKWYPKLCGSV